MNVPSSLLSQGRRRGCDKFNTKGKSLLIFGNRVKPRNQKYSAFHVGQITGISFANPAHTRGVSRSSRCVGLGCDGRGRVRRFLCRTKRCPRTAKSCGPGAAMLASSSWNYFAGDGGKKPAHRGEHEVSRKAIAQGMSDCLRCPVCSCAPFFALLGTRDRGCSAHPAFPAPSVWRGRERI